MAKTVDPRTYLLLEKAFVRRLQRSWRQQSAPLYAAIAEACRNKQWDKARLLVTDLDMTEVGTQNREWIQYMLLSCAVFGANTVAKGKPSFVGVGSFDTFLKQTTNNILQYLELTATAQIQREAMQSIAEDEAKTKAIKWEEAQHPRDKEGRFTETVYHGTGQDFSTFDLARGGEATGAKNGVLGAFFTTDSNKAGALYAGRRGTLMEARLKFTNPAKFKGLEYENDASATVNKETAEYVEKPLDDLTEEDFLAWRDFLIRQGHDGIEVALYHGEKDYIVFNAEQIVRTKWEEAQHPRDKEGQFTSVGDEPAPDWGQPSPPLKKGQSVVVFRVGRKEPLAGRNAANAEGLAAHLLNHEEYGVDPIGDTITAYKVTLTEDMQEGYVPVREGQDVELPPVVGRGTYYAGHGYVFPTSGHGFTAVPLASIPSSELTAKNPHELAEQIRARFFHAKKWEEAQHPRDKDGQFTASGTHAVDMEGHTGMEGGGPEREKWEALNDAVMEAGDAEWTARDAHVTIASELELKYPANTPYTDYENADFEAYHTSKTNYEDAALALARAEEALKAQEPAMRKEVVKNLATDVAKRLGIDPSIIHVVDEPPQAFDVGDKHFTEAGHYSPGSGQIELNARNITYGNAVAVKGIVAHEISHHIYHELKDEAEAEFQHYLSKAVGPDDKHTAWYHERFTRDEKHQRRLRPEFRAEFEKEFPASMVMSRLSDNEPFTGLSDYMIKENGHSQYAKSYWSKETVARRGYEPAVNETIAEVTRYLVYPSSYHEPDHPPSLGSQWLRLTGLMHKWYREQA